jgi:hypothetical protein
MGWDSRSSRNFTKNRMIHEYAGQGQVAVTQGYYSATKRITLGYLPYSIWLAYQLGIYERGGGVGVLAFALGVLADGTLSTNYVRRRFRARVPGPRRRL